MLENRKNFGKVDAEELIVTKKYLGEGGWEECLKLKNCCK